MKQFSSIIIFCTALWACNNPSTRDQAGTARDTPSEAEALQQADQEQKYCFLRLEGTQSQDSSYIQLVIRNETVSGIYNAIPYEKDARRGTVMGKLNDDILDLVWTFSQEGTQDTLRVLFEFHEGKLRRKPLAVDTLTGRQVTLDTDPFSEVYEPVDCAPTDE